MLKPHQLVLAARIAAAAATFAAAARLMAQQPTDSADWLLSSRALGVIRVCSRLDTVRAVFSAAKDTVLRSEGASWPGKVVHLGRGSLLFESSWSDRTHIWTISATTPVVHTARAHRVGTLVVELAAAESISVRDPEGQPILVLEAEHIGALLDSSAEARYLARPHTERQPAVADLPAGARVASLFTLGGCRRGRQGR